MYVRRRKNKSGSVSVFVGVSQREPGKKHPQTVMIKSFGSSKDPREIEEMVKKAQQYKEKAKKLRPKFTPLKIRTSADISDFKIQNIGIKQVYGTIFDRYFSGMKLNKVNRQLLRDVALMRIAKPVSKLKTAAIAEDFGFLDLSINKIYKLMDSLSKESESNIELIKNYVYSNSTKLLGSNQIEVLFYDLTTIYFENNSQSDLKEFGYSKDGKSQHVQISLALIVTKFGLPLGYEIFKGNIYEGKTLLPVLNKLKETYKIDKVTIVADSAMLSEDNLEQLAVNKFNYIVAARIRNVKSGLKKEILNLDSYTQLNEDLRYKVIQLAQQSLIVCYSKKRAAKDQYERELTLKRIDKLLGTSVKGKLRGSLKKSYITLSQNSTIEIDETKLEASKLLDGYFGFYTNTTLSAVSVIDQYRGLWQIEQSFRITKHNLAIRPVYHYTDRRIKAHFAICFLALSLLRTVEYLLSQAGCHIALETLHQMLNNVNAVQIMSNEQIFNIVKNLPSEIAQVYKILDISTAPTFMQTV